MFYMEQTWAEMRHLETLRERLTFIVVTIASAIIGFIMQQKFAPETYPLVFFVIALGIFGYLATLKLFQIHQMSQGRLNKWYSYLLTDCGTDPKLMDLRDEADAENKVSFPNISGLRHNHFWAIVHILVIVAGLFLITKY